MVKQSLSNIQASINREAAEKGGLKLRAFGLEKVLIPRTTLTKTYDNIFSTLRNVPGYDNFVGKPVVKPIKGVLEKGRKWLGTAFIPDYDIKSLSDPMARDTMMNLMEGFRNSIEGGEVHAMDAVEEMFGEYFEKLGLKKGKKTARAAAAVAELPEDIRQVAEFVGKEKFGKIPTEAVSEAIFARRENLSNTLREVVVNAGEKLPDKMAKNLIEVADLMDAVPEHDMWNMVDTLKRTFNEVADKEVQHGLLSNVREHYMTHVLTPKGYEYTRPEGFKVIPFGKVKVVEHGRLFFPMVKLGK
jgi:hypothetical protein